MAEVIKETRNSKLLRSFVEYCEMHPDHRFWQALRNWSEYPFIIARDSAKDRDTFYLEGKRHDDGI